MIYRVLADVAMTTHFLFLVFVVVGGFLAWRWPRLWFAHLAAALYALAIITFEFDCFLTPIEHEMRLRAGQEGLEPTGFIDTYIEDVVYPGDRTNEVRWAVAAVIFVSWVGALLLYLRRRRVKRAPRHAVPD
jgi:hypothetical protein